MKISSLLRIILVIEIIVLLGTAMTVARDYQDSWLLEGLEIPFIVFIVTYVAYCFVEDRIPWIILFAVIARIVFGLIPNMKYVWFQGTAYDEHMHYRLYQSILQEGGLPNDPIYNNMLYLNTPLVHILLSITTIVTSLPQLMIFKYMPILSWLPYPLIIYVMMKKIAPGDQQSQKYALLLSSIPVRASLSYNLVGTLFGSLFLIMLFAWFISLLQVSKRNWFVVVIISTFALVMSHSYSPIVLIIGLTMTYMIYNTNYLRKNYKRFKTFSAKYIMLIALIAIFWLLFVATNLFRVSMNIFEQWINSIIGYGIPQGGRTFTDINFAFFGLSLENQLRIIIVNYGGSLFVIFLTLIGVILVTSKKLYQSKQIIFSTLFLISTWTFFIFQLIATAARSGLIEFFRVFSYSLLFAPLFIGLLLSKIHKKLGNMKLNFFVILSIIALVTIEFYGFQPLLPIASSVRSNLPSDEYIIYVDNVNSVYQRNMITFAEEYINNGMIAYDPITRNQILGLTNYNFSQTHLVGYYPFDESIHEEKFDYFLIHRPGKSGWSGVKPEVGTRDFVHEITCNSSIIYSNGESYILTEPFFYNTT